MEADNHQIIDTFISSSKLWFKFFIWYGPVALLSALGFYIGMQIGFIHPEGWNAYIFLVALTIIGHTIIAKGFANDYKNFLLYYFGNLVFRFLIITGLLTVYLAFILKEQIVLFAINFIILYFINLCFEILFLLYILRYDKNRDKKN